MRELDEVLAALAGSRFRRRFRLRDGELDYLRRKGTAAVLRHAGGLLETRLFPALPPGDGRQTPMRGHPVFLAQHATGTCCRGCLRRWHGIDQGRKLTRDERRHVLAVIARWLEEQERAAPEEDPSVDAQLGLGVD